MKNGQDMPISRRGSIFLTVSKTPAFSDWCCEIRVREVSVRVSLIACQENFYWGGVRAAANESQKTRNKKQNGLAHLRFPVCVTPKQKKNIA